MVSVKIERQGPTPHLIQGEAPGDAATVILQVPGVWTPGAGGLISLKPGERIVITCEAL